MNNPKFDLVQVDGNRKPIRWCEVKAMTGSLDDRPVTLSRAQFDCALANGEDYWIYVVERVGTPNARVVRIQDTAGNAKTYTFDRGWLAIAKRDGSNREL